LFELTAARNKDIANQIVVGNIDNCHLSEAILEKQELLI
jgi:mannose-1-phosphate guanylyltransferase